MYLRVLLLHIYAAVTIDKSLKAITPVATDVTVALSVRLYVIMYVVCRTHALVLKPLGGMRCHLAETLV